jgi:hypothetical protein
LALHAGVFGVVLMAGSFGGTRSTDRLRRLSRVSAFNVHSQPKTSNKFLEIIGSFSRRATGLAIPVPPEK